MKRFVAILLLLSMVLSCLLLAGCEQKKSTLWDNDEERFDELRRVCNLTTVKFTIHKNVISSVVRSTFFDLFDLPVDWFDYQFTVEYDAQVEVGVKIQSIDVTPPATENGMYLVTVVLEKPLTEVHKNQLREKNAEKVFPVQKIVVILRAITKE